MIQAISNIYTYKCIAYFHMRISLWDPHGTANDESARDWIPNPTSPGRRKRVGGFKLTYRWDCIHQSGFSSDKNSWWKTDITFQEPYRYPHYPRDDDYVKALKKLFYQRYLFKIR